MWRQFARGLVGVVVAAAAAVAVADSAAVGAPSAAGTCAGVSVGDVVVLCDLVYQCMVVAVS